MIEDIRGHLIALELRLQDPLFRKDTRAMDELLSEEFREFGASGRVRGRTEILSALAAESPYEIVSTDFKCLQIAGSVALLTYHACAADRKTLRSSVWRMEGDRWRMVFHQGTLTAANE